MKLLRFYQILGLGAMLMSLPACDGILDGIYDTPRTTNGYGFNPNGDGITGTLFIDATDYTQWTYINLHTEEIDSTRITDESGAEIPMGENASLPNEWDFALHRYDVKTNDGAVLETEATSMDAVLLMSNIPTGNYVEDSETEITIDMSGMMDGNIRYATSDYNTELAKWLNVDTSTMPPIYTLSNKVYIVQLKDGTHAALRLNAFRNAQNTSGYLTIEYAYPLEKAIKQ